MKIILAYFTLIAITTIVSAENLTIDGDLSISGKLGIGEQSPVKTLHLSGDSLFSRKNDVLDSSINLLNFSYGARSYAYTFVGGGYSTLFRGINGSYIIGVDRINGSYENPSPVVEGDRVFEIRTSALAPNGTNYQEYMARVEVDGEPIDGLIPLKYYFAQQNIVVTSQDRVGIGLGSQTPQTKLHVVGNTTLDGDLNLTGSLILEAKGDIPMFGQN